MLESLHNWKRWAVTFRSCVRCCYQQQQLALTCQRHGHARWEQQRQRRPCEDARQVALTLPLAMSAIVFCRHRDLISPEPLVKVRTFRGLSRGLIWVGLGSRSCADTQETCILSWIGVRNGMRLDWVNHGHHMGGRMNRYYSPWKDPSTGDLMKTCCAPF